MTKREQVIKLCKELGAIARSELARASSDLATSGRKEADKLSLAEMKQRLDLALLVMSGKFSRELGAVAKENTSQVVPKSLGETKEIKRLNTRIAKIESQLEGVLKAQKAGKASADTGTKVGTSTNKSIEEIVTFKVAVHDAFIWFNDVCLVVLNGRLKQLPKEFRHFEIASKREYENTMARLSAKYDSRTLSDNEAKALGYCRSLGVFYHGGIGRYTDHEFKTSNEECWEESSGAGTAILLVPKDYCGV